jgi:hypothetical protein
LTPAPRLISRIQRQHWAEGLALILIIGLAAYLRFGWLGVNSFAGDEARISLDALRLTRGGEFIYIAQPSSTGIPFLPASVWMFAPPFLLSADPLVATAYVCFLSLLTVVGVWWIGRHWNAFAGLTSALFLAATPYAVFYGRSIWQPNLLPFLTLIWLWAGWRGVCKTGRTQAFSVALHCCLGLLIWQVHFAGLALVVATVYVVLRFRWWTRPLPVLMGCALAGLCAIPYAYYVFSHDPQIAARVGQVGSEAAAVDLSAARNLVHMALGYDWGYLALGEYDTFSRLPYSVLTAASLLAAGLTGVIRLRIQPAAPSAQPQTDARTLSEFILLALLISPLFFLRHSTPVLPHYQLVALPAAALTAGAATTLWQQRARRLGVLAVTAGLSLVWTAQIAASLDLAAVERPPQSALSSILRESRDAAGGLAASGAALFFTHGDDPAINGEAAVFRALLWEHPDLRIVNGQTTLILPDQPAVLMSTLAPFQAWEELAASGLAEAVTSYPRRPPADAFVAVYYDSDSTPGGFQMVDATLLEDGAELLGWRARRVGERLRVSTLWRVTSLPPNSILQQFHHLYALGSTLETPLFVSDVPLSVQQWRTGDRVIVMGDFIDIPAGTYEIVVGHYRLSDLTRIPAVGGRQGAVRLGSYVWADD